MFGDQLGVFDNAQAAEVDGRVDDAVFELLKLGVGFGYWQAPPPKDFVAVAQAAEKLSAFRGSRLPTARPDSVPPRGS